VCEGGGRAELLPRHPAGAVGTGAEDVAGMAPGKAAAFGPQSLSGTGSTPVRLSERRVVQGFFWACVEGSARHMDRLERTRGPQRSLIQAAADSITAWLPSPSPCSHRDMGAGFLIALGYSIPPDQPHARSRDVGPANLIRAAQMMGASDRDLVCACVPSMPAIFPALRVGLA